MEIRKILVLLDFGRTTADLLSYSMALSRYLKLDLWAQHIYYLPFHVAGESAVPEDAREAYEHNIRNTFTAFSEKIPALTEVRLVLASGHFIEQVNRLIEREKINLVVAGNHGGGVLTNVLGSHTLKLIQHAHCPVLSVPEGISFSPFERLVWATDLQPVQAGTWSFLSRFVQQCGAQLDIIHVEDHAMQFSKSAHMMYSGDHTFPHRIFTLFLKDVEKGIQQHIQDYQNDLLVLMPKAHPFFDLLFQKSMTRKFAFQGQIPLLTLPH